MAIVRPRATAKKTKPAPRTKPRIEDTEPAGTTRKTAVHRGQAKVEVVGDNEIVVTGQGSEVVPVAQFANVTIGPVAIQMRFRVPDPNILAGIDWSDDPDAETEMTDEQREAFEYLISCAMATQRAVDTVINRDRAVVEESVRLYNEREAEKEEAEKKKSSSRRR